MFPFHAAVALRVVRGHSGWSYSFEDGTTFQTLEEGDPTTQYAQVIERILQHIGLDRQVVVLTRVKVLLEKAADISAVFPNLTIMAPYDHASEAEYQVAHDGIDQIGFPEREAIEIASDASVSPTRAVWAWVSRHPNGEYFFDFGLSPVADSTVAEALGIVNASVQGKSSRPVRVLSDSMNALRSVSKGLKEQEIPEILRPVRAPNLRALVASMNSRHAEGNLSLEWVKGHGDHDLNVLADQIATYVRRRLRTEGDDTILRNEVCSLVREFKKNGIIKAA